MKGKRLAFDATVERDLALAWHIENFGRAGKTLRPLGYYLRKVAPRKPQTAEQVVAIFEGFAAQGLANIRIREREG